MGGGKICGEEKGEDRELTSHNEINYQS
jgi:hypothetical protein